MTGSTPDQPLDRDEAPGPRRAPFPDAWWELPLRTRQWIAVGIVGLVLLGGYLLIARLVTGEPNPTIYVAKLDPERVAIWDSLAECESEGQWDLVSGNGYAGGLQFNQVTWEEVGGSGSPAEASREEQIMRGEFLYELKGWDGWPRCAAKLGLTE